MAVGKKNGRCIKTVFDRTILCAGSMNDFITIKSRELQENNFDDLQSQEAFVTVDSFSSYLEAVKYTARFQGVNIASNITHLCYLPFDNTVYELDLNSLFLEYETNNKKRYFKLEGIENYGEQDEYLLLHLKETGFIDIKANEG